MSEQCMKSCCMCFTGEPVESKNGKIQVRQNPNIWQVNMCDACCSEGPCGSPCWWGLGQCIPFTCICTQFCLRRKVLDYDMSKYVCCQGYFNCCCLKAGNCCEKQCPYPCLCLEATFCNSCAVSASRIYVMDKYQLSSDPCDYRIIAFSNCMQLLACICNILAIFIDELREVACIIDRIADFVYHVVSGCMTAQVIHELKYQETKKAQYGAGGAAVAEPIHTPSHEGGHKK